MLLKLGVLDSYILTNGNFRRFSVREDNTFSPLPLLIAFQLEWFYELFPKSGIIE